ncbi:hypothetical protein AgCh_019460 [Apium graveolens]
MASLAKLNLVALLFLLLLSVWGAPCTSATLHQRGKQNSRWYSDCRKGYRKLGFMNCENAGGLTNKGRFAWSQSLKTALSPPPSPVQKYRSVWGGSPPPLND